MKNPIATNVAKSVAMLLGLILALLVPPGSASAEDGSAFSQAQLEQALAPIALYPDPLLSQILMASTYPLEVVDAARWSRDHAYLRGEDAVRAAENEDWDPSVKSLLAFPHVLARMEEDLQWLQTLGDAFLDQEPQVMDAVQNLRRRAQLAGNLRSDGRQHVLETGPLLVLQPANPQIIYVPYYDPRVVYGPWWWPHYSPVYWRPFPGYSAWPGVASGFYWGPSIRLSVGYFFGGFDWSHRHVRVVHSNYYYSAENHRATLHRDRPPGAWHHDPGHRRGVAYRGPEVQQRFAEHGVRPDSSRHRTREDVRRQGQQRVQADSIPAQRIDGNHPAVQVSAQPDRSSNVQAGRHPDAQISPISNRRSYSDRPATQVTAQPERSSGRQASRHQDARPYLDSTRGDFDRPAVTVVPRPERPGNGQVARHQDAQSYPNSNRHSEARNDVRRPAVEPKRETPVQPVVQRVTAPQPPAGDNDRSDRRGHGKDQDGDRGGRAERRQAIQAAPQAAPHAAPHAAPQAAPQAAPRVVPPTVAAPQELRSRSDMASSRGDIAERSARPHAGEARRDPRFPSPVVRQEAQRDDDRRERAQDKHESRRAEHPRAHNEPRSRRSAGS